ncbi:MAG: CCA tRNA nucleotidyltransferase [Butyrivibrio sp.]|uniref:CCA tRNA nucleotidyltransferase n=1 Tax=Butyrivibrio sp. TaxID=28121 RepID=UPI001B08D7A5|nr:CCA tRNA nucleotidyltransferase [Butyrivibrio sp.]MBO6242059.1 CCA tRNA nucleotidyltransferase [Butyrivibrio sp.]
MKIKLPDNVKMILDRLHRAGYEAYAVGGCVRDSILGRVPGDWDITTNALPEDTKKLFKRTIDTGIEHGTVTVMVDKEGYEVTTYRIDGKYEDSRHPSEVTFTKSLTEDMKRRDFTINAMAYNEEEGLIDRFGGLEDIKERVIRCVGNPKERFSEDALRIMRAVRFSAQLDYRIENETREAITELAETLNKISAERIQTELVKLLLSDHPEKLMTAYELGITKVIMPEFDKCMDTPQNNPHHMYNVGEHIVKSVQNIRADKLLRLTMLMHDMGKADTISIDNDGICHFYGHAKVSEDIAGNIFKRLKFDRDTMDRACNLIRYHDDRFPATPRNVRRAMNRIGNDFPLYIEVRYADTLAQSQFARDEKLKLIDDTFNLYQEIIEKKEAVTIKDLAVNGKDLMGAGVSQGKEIGRVLKAMLEDVLDDPGHNSKDYLLEPERLRSFLEGSD